MADHQRQHGQNAIQKRHAHTSHGRGGQLGNHDDHHQLKGLKLPHLPLAHQPHGDDRRRKKNHRPGEYRQHGPRLPSCPDADSMHREQGDYSSSSAASDKVKLLRFTVSSPSRAILLSSLERALRSTSK